MRAERDKPFNDKIVADRGLGPFAIADAAPMFGSMRLLIACTAALFALAAPVTAQEEVVETASEELSVVEQWQADPTLVFDAAEVDLDALQYIARPIVVFANSPNDPMVDEQLEFLAARVEELVVRDVIIILDTDPAAQTDVRTTLRPRAFQLVLMDKDGRVHLRKPFPWEVREITRTIDKMPLRLQEIGR